MWSFDCPSRTIDHSDEKVLYDPEIYEQLLEGGVDQLMAQHVAHLFIRHHHYHLVNFFLKWPHNVITFWSTAHLKRSFFAQGIPWACSPTKWRRMEIMMRWRIWSVRYGIWKYQNSLLWDNSLIQIFLLTRVQNKNNKNWARKDLELILIPWFKY